MTGSLLLGAFVTVLWVVLACLVPTSAWWPILGMGIALLAMWCLEAVVDGNK